jgi:hypothetical protein
MARPHIEFIQSQALPWIKGLYGGARPEVEMKILSQDADNAESSTLIRYPHGWKQTRAEHLLVDEELFVLDGAVEIAGVEYGRHCYAYLPAGYVRPSASSQGGAVVLTMFSGTPSAEPGDPPDGLFNPSILVKHKDTLSMPWEDLPQALGGSPAYDELPAEREDDDEMYFDAGLRYAARIKRLWRDPDTGEFTKLFAILPQTFPRDWLEKPVQHECVEECYLLAGELAGNLGVMYPGAYFWRPPGIYHGPYGTLTGWMHLSHLRYGKHENLRAEKDATFEFDAPFRPVLPPDYRKYADAYPHSMPTGTTCF